MKRLATYAMSVALLTGFALAGASAQVTSVPVGDTSVNDRIKCNVTVGGRNYFATAPSRGEAEAKLQQAGYGGQGIVCASVDDEDAGGTSGN